MRVLMFSLDKQFFEPGGDARNRMIEYGKLVERLDIIALTRDKFKPEQIAPNVRIYPTNSWHKLFYICDGIRLGKKIIKENNCDLVVTQEPYITGLAGYCLVKRSKIKLLISVYGNNIFDPHWLAEAPRHRIFKFIGQRVFRRADAIQTDGFETVDDLKARYGEKVFWKPIVPSNIDEFKKLEKSFDGQVKFLFVGRLVRQKNLPLLMEVLEQLSKTAATGNVAVTIIGDGP
ncbi:MAG: glycosyltransferase, partial [Parcubacteria group bacterium]